MSAAPPEGALGRQLRQLIRQEGPISLSRFMADAVAHYYSSRDPFGAAGDFTTAPEISQMFGELLGLWVADTWQRLGRPRPFDLIELGPGRGTLMADMLRALAKAPDCAGSLRVRLVEASAPLIDRQRATLSGRQITWHRRLDEIAPAPFVLVANEFFDALPIRQFERHADGWHERMVTLDGNDEFVIALAPDPTALPGEGIAAAPGSVLEICSSGRTLAASIGERAAQHAGAALLIDYGAPQSGLGDTLQALSRHRFVPPLQRPGEVDLTAHVDFAALGRAGRNSGARLHGPVGQGRFLQQLGLAARAARLKQLASPAQLVEIDAAYRRLTAADAMGTLFQVLCLSSPHLRQAAGFEPE